MMKIKIVKWHQILRGFKKSKNKQILKVIALYIMWNPENCQGPPTCGQDDLVLLIYFFDLDTFQISYNSARNKSKKLSRDVIAFGQKWESMVIVGRQGLLLFVVVSPSENVRGNDQKRYYSTHFTVFWLAQGFVTPYTIYLPAPPLFRTTTPQWSKIFS